MLAKLARGPEHERYPAEICRLLHEQGGRDEHLASVSRIVRQLVEDGWATSRPLSSAEPDLLFYTLTDLGEQTFRTLCPEAQRLMGLRQQAIVEGLIGL